MSVSPKFGNPAGWYGAPGKLLHLTFVQKHDNLDTLEKVSWSPEQYLGKVNGTLTWQFDDGRPQESEVELAYHFFHPGKGCTHLDIKARGCRTSCTRGSGRPCPRHHRGRQTDPTGLGPLAPYVTEDLRRLVRRWVEGEGESPTKPTPADFRFVYNRPTPWAVRMAKYDGDAAIARDEWATACFNALFKEYPIKRSEFEPWEYRSTDEAERDVGVGGGPGSISAQRLADELGVEWTERDWATLMSTDEQLRARKRQRLVDLDKEREALAAEVEQETEKETEKAKADAATELDQLFGQEADEESDGNR